MNVNKQEMERKLIAVCEATENMKGEFSILKAINIGIFIAVLAQILISVLK